MTFDGGLSLGGFEVWGAVIAVGIDRYSSIKASVVCIVATIVGCTDHVLNALGTVGTNIL